MTFRVWEDVAKGELALRKGTTRPMTVKKARIANTLPMLPIPPHSYRKRGR